MFSGEIFFYRHFLPPTPLDFRDFRDFSQKMLDFCYIPRFVPIALWFSGGRGGGSVGIFFFVQNVYKCFRSALGTIHMRGDVRSRRFLTNLSPGYFWAERLLFHQIHCRTSNIHPYAKNKSFGIRENVQGVAEVSSWQVGKVICGLRPDCYNPQI